MPRSTSCSARSITMPRNLSRSDARVHRALPREPHFGSTPHTDSCAANSPIFSVPDERDAYAGFEERHEDAPEICWKRWDAAARRDPCKPGPADGAWRRKYRNLRRGVGSDRPADNTDLRDDKAATSRRGRSRTSSRPVRAHAGPRVHRPNSYGGCHGGDPSVHHRRCRRDARRSAAAYRRDALAQQGTRRRSVAGRAAGDAQELARYWENDYDWRRCEERLDACRSSRRRSTGWTFTSSTCSRGTRTRCR